MESTARSLIHLRTKLNLLGESVVFVRLLERIKRFARCDATVLIDGETGTGKELAARAIHYLSARGDGPFIPINCGSLPDALIGSELFGHSRGAFTDAREARQGLIAQAEGGTLFLDEIETLTARAQVALLRFLQDHEYRPLGAGRSHTANVRVIGATNADLTELSRRAEFRHDLLYRLNVLTLDVPPLRERGEDTILLAQHFLNMLGVRYKRPGHSLAPEALVALRGHDWPGNVRELENLIHREFLLADQPQLQLYTLRRTTRAGKRGLGGPSVGRDALRVEAQRPSVVNATPAAFREAKARVIADFEKEYVRNLLAQANGNVSLAARLAGKERSRFNRLVRKYDLRPREFKDAETPRQSF
jgi:DNA-binding NtrC family response regulator